MRGEDHIYIYTIYIDIYVYIIIVMGAPRRDPQFLEISNMSALEEGRLGAAGP